ncbi:cellulose binding domain-containing protein [Paenibacillus campi]|uniref:cellulose binding domain-containing protein n=1 Tax=Paenibacillus campi TaxID=3106031 RepID=UPI002AFE60FE|nr:cellulose binding domain-containing protein [Paenibacillus sp. SGZ-1014]
MMNMVHWSKKASAVLAVSILAAGSSLLAAPSANAAIETTQVMNDIKWDNTSAPAAPSNVTARSGSNQVVVTWTPVQGASSYEVRRYNVVNNTYDSVQSNTYAMLTTGITDAVFADTSVSNGKMYGYVVDAVLPNGQKTQMSAPVIGAPAEQAGTVNQSLVLQSQISNSGSSTINPTINILNTGTQDVNLSDIRVRYYFTGGTGLNARNITFNKFPFNTRNVEAYVVNMPQPQAGADSYVELLFNAEAGVIPAGGESGDMSFTIQRTSGNVSSDYSYSSNTAMAENAKIVVYYQGGPVWGHDPGVKENDRVN